MKQFIVAALVAFALPFNATASAQDQSPCEKCQVIIEDIRGALSQRCDTVPTPEQVRLEPLYMFLSIFDEISQGVDKSMRARIYNAALDGMACDNIGLGVEAAQQMSKKVMMEHRS